MAKTTPTMTHNKNNATNKKRNKVKKALFHKCVGISMRCFP